MKTENQSEHYITLFKGGTAERKFNVNLEGQIPDLWHIAQAEKDLDCKRAILGTWHLAHEMRKALVELFEHQDHLVEALQSIISAQEKIQESSDYLPGESHRPLTDPMDQAMAKAKAALEKAGAK